MNKIPYQKLCAVIGYSFKNEKLLTQALTHKSSCSINHNQRLEFLGDAILNIIITRTMFEQYPQENEGVLSQRRANIIQGQTLTQIAFLLGLDQHLKYATDILNVTHRMMEDSLEALIGAIYLDSNLAVAQEVVMRWLHVLQLDTAPTNIHPKTLLQEKLQLSYKIHPHYRLKHHDVAQNLYTVELFIGPPLGITYQASGASRKDLEKQLAQQAIAHL
jgi:ribonuclease-3